MPTPLELAVPQFQFRSHHSRWIDARPHAVWDALVSLRFSDLTITKPMVGLRYLGRPPISDGALLDTGPITILQLDSPHYAVGGAVGQPWQLHPERRPLASLEDFVSFDEPGWAKYLTEFSLTAEQGGTRLRTETRGYCTDDHSWRRFRCYWAAIRFGSGLVRRDILRTVGRTAVRR